MFECHLVQGSVLRKVMEAISALVSSANIECTSSGLNMQAMDESSVCLVQMELNSDSFDPYRCDKNITLGIDLKNLIKIFRCGGGEDSIRLRCSDNSDFLTIVIENKDSDKVATFDMKLMDIDAEHLAIPDTSPSVVVSLASSEFQRICRDLSQFGDSMSIACTKEGITFSTVGATEGSAKITLKPTTCTDEKKGETVKIDMNEPVSQTYACRYLGSFVKATPLSDTITISMKADAPLVAEYSIGTMGHLRFYLAPKVEDNEEM